MRAKTYLAKGYTRVIFRVFKPRKAPPGLYDPGGDVIALFPDLAEGRPGLVTSYQHVGQHGAADLAGVWKVTRAATYRERDALLAELKGRGYKLVERVRWVRLKG